MLKPRKGKSPREPRRQPRRPSLKAVQRLRSRFTFACGQITKLREPIDKATRKDPEAVRALLDKIDEVVRRGEFLIDQYESLKTGDNAAWAQMSQHHIGDDIRWLKRLKGTYHTTLR